MEPDCARKMLKRVLQRAGLDEMRFHDLRHTFATLALQNGVDVKTLSGILGHYSAGFTLDTYAPVSYTHLDVYKRQIKDMTEGRYAFGNESPSVIAKFANRSGLFFAATLKELINSNSPDSIKYSLSSLIEFLLLSKISLFNIICFH